MKLTVKIEAIIPDPGYPESPAYHLSMWDGPDTAQVALLTPMNVNLASYLIEHQNVDGAFRRALEAIIDEPPGSASLVGREFTDS